MLLQCAFVLLESSVSDQAGLSRGMETRLYQGSVKQDFFYACFSLSFLDLHHSALLHVKNISLGSCSALIYTL